MNWSPPSADDGANANTAGQAHGPGSVNVIVGRIRNARDAAEAMELLGTTARCLGATAAAFVSYVEEPAGMRSYGLLLACDPLWPEDFGAEGWHSDDPWLRHASRRAEPAFASEIALDGHAERSFVESAARRGFAHALIVPAPMPPSAARVGALYLGFDSRDSLEALGTGPDRPVMRGLAMELHDWWLGRMRAERLERWQLSDTEVDLLRREAAGQGSKAIANALDTEATAVDCRFQRIIAKMDTTTRRESARLAALYGVI
jgi:DNA-binding CsgD family transcriptional regulator